MKQMSVDLTLDFRDSTHLLSGGIITHLPHSGFQYCPPQTLDPLTSRISHVMCSSPNTPSFLLVLLATKPYPFLLLAHIYFQS